MIGVVSWIGPLDALGGQAQLLCALIGLALGASIVVGFVLLRRAERTGWSAGLPVREMGLIALWRLGRDLRSDSPRQLREV